MFPEEDGFHSRLDEVPDDQTCRRALADWLRDRDDPRADGYALLADLGFCPLYPGLHSSTRGRRGRIDWYCGTDLNSRHVKAHAPAMLPHAWFRRVRTRDSGKHHDHRWWIFAGRRRELEDAVAVAWAGLPPKEKEKILSGRFASR